MYCKHCQKEVTPAGRSCPECGTVIVELEKTMGAWDGGSLSVNPTAASSANLSAVPVNKKVGFGKAIKLMFKNYFNFSGRASKSEFWWAFLFNMIVSTVITGLASFLPPVAILSLGLMIPGLSLSVRRLHDIGKNGWNILLGLIPLAGMIILIVYFVKDSDGDNRWGKVETQSAPTAAESEEERIYRLSQEHEPRNINTPEGKKIVDQALGSIIPTYSGSENLASAIMLCNPLDIKANVRATDKDTLLIIIKGLRSHIDMGEDANTIDMIQKYVISVLKEQL